MKRRLALLPAFLAAGAAAALVLATPGRAGIGPVDFTLARTDRGNGLQLRLNGAGINVSNDVPAAALAGFDPAQFGRDGGRIGFVLARQPGRLDCRGLVFRGRGHGQCGFSADPGFAGFLASHGIARPDERQWLQLAITGVTRDLVQALADAHYPVPTLNQLAGMAAVGVTPGYLAALAAHGGRPGPIEQLIGLKAVGVTPAYVGELEAAGYRNLSPQELTELRALGVTAAWIAGFAPLGYRHLPVARLVEMKALGVTPADLRAARRPGEPAGSADALARARALGALTRDR